MPIVIPPQSGRPLDQGDILKGVKVAATVAPTWKASFNIEADFVLVVSRPCKAVRAEKIIVAPITTFDLDLITLGQRLDDGSKEKSKEREAPKRPSLDRLRRYLQGIRDGGDVTDSFYLGSLDPTKPGRRYAADLSALFTILLPEGEDHAERRTWVQECRVARLDEAYIRDLHIRLHLTFGRLGFDDHAWYTERDLDDMILAGEAEVVEREKDLKDTQISTSAAEAKGDDASKRAGELKKKQDACDLAKTALRPYLDERARRKSVEAAVQAGADTPPDASETK